MNKLFLLLVEDNEGDIVLTQEAFEERNIVEELAVVRDGEEAVHFLQEAFLQKKLPNLVLLDINIPRMNGYEVLQYIKKDEGLKHIPVVMLTTSSSPNDILNAYQNYVNGYITKPVNMEEFGTIIQKIEEYWLKTVQLP